MVRRVLLWAVDVVLLERMCKRGTVFAAPLNYYSVDSNHSAAHLTL